MQDLNITTIQFDIFWKDSKANLDFLTTQLQHLKTDVIVLPEMFNTGFCMDANDIAEDENGITYQWMQKTAKQLNCAIGGSISFKENGLFYNQFIFVDPQGNSQIYRKRHTFTYGNEHLAYEKGTSQTMITYKGWKIAPFICYDLRFPVWSRNTQAYDIALYVANWPARRAFAWNSLLTARAIENMSYVVAVNRIGIDGNNLHYQGDSKVLDMMGNVLCDSKNDAIMHQVTLSKQILEESRSSFGFLNDRDDFILK